MNHIPVSSILYPGFPPTLAGHLAEIFQDKFQQHPVKFKAFINSCKLYTAFFDKGLSRQLKASKRHAHHFIHLVEQYFDKEHSPAYYATAIHVGNPTLRKICQKELQHPPLYWINFRKIWQALILLKKTVQPIKSIAFEVGIHDVSYFSRLFKNYLGMTPSALRRIMLSQ